LTAGKDRNTLLLMGNEQSSPGFAATRRQFLVGSGTAALAAATPLSEQAPSPGQPATGARPEPEWPAPDSLLRRRWTAQWIAVPSQPATLYGVYCFRKALDLAAKPVKFVVHVTADNRYQVYVNGKRVSWGPARGDAFHWRYETVDLAPYLEAGKNVLAAVVWNFGDDAPMAQMTLQTGFVVEGDTAAERAVATGPTWKCLRDESYSPLVFSNGQMRGYFVAGPADRVVAAKHPHGWMTREFDDSKWPAAVNISTAAGRESSDAHTNWLLVARTIPPMRETPERLREIRRVAGIARPAAFPATQEELRIPANAKATLLLDQTYLTTAYPELTVSGGKDSTIRLRYAETLFTPAAPGQRSVKGNRGEVEGKEFVGYHDEYVPDGGVNREFRPLWWRTYRYLELDVQTAAEPLTIHDLKATAVGYPFERRARFDAGSEEITRILDVGWRTAQLCAHETYMDCPYYEQLQYGGDTRIQCLVSLFNTGDARLMRNAIDLINDSRGSDGCTQSRYPGRLQQYIPAWTLWWIGMVRDYWWYADDPAFVRRMLPGVRAVLSFFEGYQKESGSMGPLPWWRNFDWVPGWRGGDAPQEADGSSAPFDLLLMLAYGWASEMETSQGRAGEADYFRGRERQMRATAQKLYWDPKRRLYADTPKLAQFSQHTNTLAVLGEVATGPAARDLMLRILKEKDMAQSAFFFRYYVHCALTKVGEGDQYLDQLGDWRAMLAKGLSTFAEQADSAGGSSRSDCHAWSAHPNIEFFRTVLGVDSAAPNFSRVAVRPHLGKLPFVKGAVPHPKGLVEVRIEPAGQRWNVQVNLPAGVPGEFDWRGAKRELKPGENRFTVNQVVG
jgi:alpha-L-rhamnosidase